MKRKLLTRAWLGALALAGCSEQLTVDTYAGDYEEALCALASDCGVFTDRIVCRSTLAWDGQLQYLVNAAGEDRVSFDATAARACLDAIAVLGCDEITINRVVFGSSQGAPEPCQDVFTGKVRNYDPCLNSEECAGDNAVCGFSPMCTDACCAGACRDRGALPEIGEMCSGSCADDAFCAFDPNDGSQVCKKRLPEGRSCAGNGDGCEDGLFCDSSGNSSAVCRKLLGAGAACEYEGCADGLTCYRMGNSGECRTLPDEGDVCSYNNYPPCARIDNVCDTNGGDGELGKCLKLPEAGQACADTYPSCAPYATCSSDGNGAASCDAYGLLGEPCNEAPNYVPCMNPLNCDENSRCVAPATKAACDPPK